MKLPARSQVPPEQLATAHHFTECDSLSPCSWQPAIGPYPEQEESNPHPHPQLHSQEDTIKMYLTDTGLEGVLWNHVAQDTDQRQFLVNMVKVLWDP
jgi:hypothetical protein